MTFMQAKHVQKGSQGGLIKDVQKQAKSVLVPNYSHYPVSKVPWINGITPAPAKP